MLVAPEHILEATLTSNWKLSLESWFITQLKMQTHEMLFCWQNYSCNNRFNCTLPHIALIDVFFPSFGWVEVSTSTRTRCNSPTWSQMISYIEVFFYLSGKINLSTRPSKFPVQRSCHFLLGVQFQTICLSGVSKNLMRTADTPIPHALGCPNSRRCTWQQFPWITPSKTNSKVPQKGDDWKKVISLYLDGNLVFRHQQ